MNELEYKPLKQVPEIIKFNNNLKILQGIFWILRILAFLGFGLLLQGKYITYSSGSVRNLVHRIGFFISLFLFLLSFLNNLLLVRRTNQQGLVSGMVAGLKVNQLLFLAKNEINSKKELRRRLAINVLPLVTSEEVVKVLAELKEEETGRMQKTIVRALQQVRDNLANNDNLVTERTPYRDQTGEYITVFPFKLRVLYGPIIRLVSSVCFLGIIMIIRGVLNVVFVDFAAKMPSLETLVLIGVGLFCLFIIPFIFFLRYHFDFRKVLKIYEKQDIQKLVDTAASGLGSRSNTNLSSFASLALAELGVEGVIEPLKPLLESRNMNVQLSAVFSLDILAVKTNYPDRFPYRIVI